MKKPEEKAAHRFLTFLLDEDNVLLMSLLADVLTVFSRYQKQLPGDDVTILDTEKLTPLVESKLTLNQLHLLVAKHLTSPCPFLTKEADNRQLVLARTCSFPETPQKRAVFCIKMNTSCTNGSSMVDVAFVSIYSLVFMVGLPLNVAALWIFFFRGALRSITTIYMKNLATSDVLLLASLPLKVFYYSMRPQLSQTVCKIAGLLLLVNMYSSIFLLTCISWDRCMAVCFPLHPRTQALRRQAKYICVGVWSLSILGAVPPYFVHKAEYTRENDTCCFDSRPQYIMDPRICSAMMVAFAVPLIIMVTCSCGLLRAVHQSMVVQMELVNGAKIQHMVVTNVAIFLGCFLPYHLVVLCYQVKALNKDHWGMVYRCVLLLACANAALDPLAYYFATDTFQHLVTTNHLFQGWGTHSNDAGRTEQLCQPLRTQPQPALPTDASPDVKPPDLKELSATGPGQ
uniref:Uncharacterized protein n=1 Tax=Sphaerodactylus townsendi TaxID=933632 RepID=A0ACB8G8Z4_9SAUR